MKSILPILLLFTISTSLLAQKNNPYEAIDKLVLQIPVEKTNSTQDIADYIRQNFTIDSQKARAAYTWVTNNIAYDIENKFALNFYDKKQDKINKVLKNHKGICEHYALLFTDICQKAGLRSYEIIGYTRKNGSTADAPHAWSSVLIDGNWYLFDPTWGAGYISNEHFVKNTNNTYYKITPEVSIKTHMPFDPMWQFLNYPVSNQEFITDTKAINQKAFFSFTDTLTLYEQQDSTTRFINIARRVEQNGVNNTNVHNELFYLDNVIENCKSNEYNKAVHNYNDGVEYLNTFIQYRNNQFKPETTDTEIQKMIDISSEKINNAKIQLQNIKAPSEQISQLRLSLLKSIAEILLRIDEQNDFLKEYFKKGKLGRRTMFRKYTWMGIPLN